MVVEEKASRKKQVKILGETALRISASVWEDGKQDGQAART
jgi:hypothetical protein